MSVRIIRAPALDEAPVTQRGSSASASHAFVPTARKIHAAEHEARVEGERVIAVAREEAAVIVAQAQAVALEIERRAHRAGVDEAKLEALSMIASARAEEAAVLDRSLDMVIAATRAVGERALGRALSIDDDALVAWAREALAPLRGARKIVVRGTASSIERLRARLIEIVPRGCDVVELVVDAQAMDGMLVARSELGEVKVTLKTQVGAFVEALRGTLSPALRGSRG